MLDAGQQPGVGALDGRGPHRAQQHRVLSVGLLCPPPARRVGEVDADSGPDVGALRTRLGADGIGDGALEVGVPGRGAGDGDRERGRGAQCHSTRAVGEPDAGDAEPVDAAALERHPVVPIGHFGNAPPNRQVAVEKPEQFMLGQLADQLSDGVVDAPLAEADLLHR